jgi:hypothetical protein
MYKICIVLQGQLYPEILYELFNTYKDVNSIILSTWNTEDINCINKCTQQGYNVIIQPPPEYITQANYQVKSLTAGFELAIKLGYTHAFRCRTDIKINNIIKLLDLLKNTIPNDKLSFLTMYKNEDMTPEYLTDQILYGPLDKLSKYFSIYQQPNDNRFVELFLMETYFKKCNISYNDIKDEICLMSRILYENNITIEYTKPQYCWQGNLLYRYYIYNRHPFSINERIQLNIQ